MQNWALTNFAAEKGPIVTILRSGSVTSGAYLLQLKYFVFSLYFTAYIIGNIGVFGSEASRQGAGKLLPIELCNSS